MLARAKRLVVSKGAKVTEFDLQSKAQPLDEVASSMLGPTGNLRAPTIRIGKTILVGFNEEVYADHLT